MLRVRVVSIPVVVSATVRDIVLSKRVAETLDAVRTSKRPFDVSSEASGDISIKVFSISGEKVWIPEVAVYGEE